MIAITRSASYMMDSTCCVGAIPNLRFAVAGGASVSSDAMADRRPAQKPLQNKQLRASLHSAALQVLSLWSTMHDMHGVCDMHGSGS